MGPRLGSRGKTMTPRLSLVVRYTLQWGRDLEVAESSNTLDGRFAGKGPLQWGRDLEVAESKKAKEQGSPDDPLQWGRDLEVAESH